MKQGRLMRVKHLVKHLYHRYVRRDRQQASYFRWLAAEGETRLRYRYSLNERSTVIDAGGYRGDFAAEVRRRHGCRVVVFEPIREYFEVTRERFRGVGGIEVIQAGLSDRSQAGEIAISGSSSTFYAPPASDARTEIVEMISVTEFLAERRIERVDLLKLNIEGGECDVLDALIESGWIAKLENIQVQFHSSVDRAVSRRSQLQRRLSTTHVKAWDFPFVWES